jgi:hypothetical protein
MRYSNAMARRDPPHPDEGFEDPYVQMWRRLSPAERLRRVWRQRRRLSPDALKRLHDEKLLSVFDPPRR